jgi:hypothetical protein
MNANEEGERGRPNDQYFVDRTVFCVIIKAMGIRLWFEYLLSSPLSMRSFYKLRTLLVLVFFALCVSLCQPRCSSADIYQYTDDDGVVHFSNVGVSTGKKYRTIKSAPAKKRATTRPTALSRTSRSTSNNPSAYDRIINSACTRHGVDPALVQAIVKVESDFDPYALSRKGAMGLMQLMPQTAAAMNVGNSFNPHDNIDGGVKYLRYLLDRYEGNLPLALAAYNAGETAVKKWGTIPPYRETQNYVKKIMKIYGVNAETFRPRQTIYVGYSDDGSLMFTDDPMKHKNLKRRAPKSL